jgi:hypothetical protein
MNSFADASRALHQSIEEEGKEEWREGALEAMEAVIVSLELVLNEKLKGSSLEPGITFSISVVRLARDELKKEQP